MATDQQGSGTAFNYLFPYEGGNYAYTNFFQVFTNYLSGVGRTYGLSRPPAAIATPDPQWLPEGVANIAVNPVNDQDAIISSSTGNLFATDNEGVTWFPIGDPSVFGSPDGYSVALAYGAPDPTAPEGVGNLGNFIYVGTQSGQIYVTQDGGGSGTSNNWINISTGLDGSAVEQIITDPTRGSHDAYAVTTDGVYYMADSIPSASNPTPTWVNITGNLKTLVYSIFGQSYNPATDPALSPTTWRPPCPRSPPTGATLSPSTRPTRQTDMHPALYVGANSGVYQSLNNGQTWTLFPDTTYGALAEGGDLPHDAVTSLSLSLGNVDANTGMPTLAGPYQTFVFTGTLTSGSATVTGIGSMTGLVAGEDITGTGIPAGTTILAVSSSTDNITLSANATATGSQSLAAANPKAVADPDLLMAATYGQGEFAINLAPLILGNTVTVSSDHRGNRHRQPAGRDRPGHHQRLERDHRLRQHHLDHRRRRDQSGRPDGHRGLQSRRWGLDAELEQLHQRPGQLLHRVQPGQLLHEQRYEDDRGLRHRRRRISGQRGDVQLHPQRP